MDGNEVLAGTWVVLELRVYLKVTLIFCDQKLSIDE